jgi:SSS family solute:Na+ symporter
MIYIVIYFIILFSISFFHKKTATTCKSFFLAKKELSLFHVTFSLLATILGASSTIGLVGLGYRFGLPASLWLISGSIGLFILSLIYKNYKGIDRVFTLPQYFGNVYGLKVEKLVAIIIVISWLGIISAQILALSSIFKIFNPGSFYFLNFLAILVIILYTYFAGQYAVVATDFFQFFLFIGGIIFLIFYLLFNANFKISAIDTQFFHFPVNSFFTKTNFFYFLIILSSVYLIGPDIHSRLFCSSNKKIAKKSLLLSCFTLIFLGLLIAFVGIVAKIFIKNGKPDEILPLLIKTILPIPFYHILFLSLISALFSSADTCLLTSVTIITRDIFKFKENLQVKYARFSIIIIGFLSFLISIHFKKIIPALLSSYSIYTSGLLFPFLLIPFKEKLKVKNKAVFLSIVIAGGMALIGNIFKIKFLVLSSYIAGGIIIFLFSILERR